MGRVSVAKTQAGIGLSLFIVYSVSEILFRFKIPETCINF
jgi:hypothetical protein